MRHGAKVVGFRSLAGSMIQKSMPHFHETLGMAQNGAPDQK
jgi:hypothetical protein